MNEDQPDDDLTLPLLNTLAKCKIIPNTGGKKVIGQSYDGAASMSSELTGVQVQMKRKFPLAYYNHCVAQRMLLSASQSAAEIPNVGKFFAATDKLINFFHSNLKRTRHLRHSLPKPGDTRWLSCDAALGVIDSCYEESGASLCEYANDSIEKAETQSKAYGRTEGNRCNCRKLPWMTYS